MRFVGSDHQEEIKKILKRYQLRPNDLLGQNFLWDQSVIEKIVQTADIKAGDNILEIGPGIGNLTKQLAKKAEYVLAVEKDRKFFQILKDQLGQYLIEGEYQAKLTDATEAAKNYGKHGQSDRFNGKEYGNVELVFSDILQFNFQERFKKEYKVVANIPYYLTAKIIQTFLSANNKPKTIVLLVQKEVAERIVAGPGELNVLAISVQLYGQPKIIEYVGKEKFFPEPKVDSTILKINVFEKTKFEMDPKFFFKIVKSCFLAKRKKLRNSLMGNLGLSLEDAKVLSAKARIDLNSRPQNLSLEEWVRVYNYLYKPK